MKAQTVTAIRIDPKVNAGNATLGLLLFLASVCMFGQGKASVTIDKQEYRPGDVVQVSAQYLGDPAQVQSADASFWTRTFRIREYPLVRNNSTGLWEGSVLVPEVSNTASPVLHVDFMTAHASDWVLLQGGRDFVNPKIVGMKVFEHEPKILRLVAFPTRGTIMRIELEAEDDAGVETSWALPQMERRAQADVTLRCEGTSPIRCGGEYDWGRGPMNQPAINVHFKDKATNDVALYSGRDFQAIFPGDLKDPSWPGYDVRAVSVRMCDGGAVSLSFTSPYLIVRYGWAALASTRIPLSSAPLTCIAEQGCQVDFPRVDFQRSISVPDAVTVSL